MDVRHNHSLQDNLKSVGICPACDEKRTAGPCRPHRGPVQQAHSWQRRWDFQDPPQPTEHTICARCHVSGPLWIPELTDVEAVESWLAE